MRLRSPLELGNGAEHMEQQRASGRCGVRSLVDHDDVDAEGLELAGDGHELVNPAGDPVQLGVAR